MRSKAKIVCCLLLTAIVLHTCIRIEVLNARNGHFLPRAHPAAGNPKWRVVAPTLLARSLERTIAIDRLTSHVSQHPNYPEPGIEEFIGPPYTDAEQALIDTEIARNKLSFQLRDWVSGMGLLQYILAPVALLSSLVLMRGTENLAVRFASVACAVSNVTSMYLMFHRGYFTSLGW
ncbi:hypothetical protein [Crateriforma conspicua]|uniref:hypothetical protein n=1 Tax=Crateriforma conspicua TaxID=2527996 RepID=UPI001189E014|nr:hypothetical protein [Crateriforma conspicua]QDV61054.1 hypothetical protein Mal65_01770 [Crateriforma conspicua]